MSREVALVVEREDGYPYGKVLLYHVALDGTLSTPCEVGGDKLSKGYGDPSEKELCTVCVKATTLPAVELVRLARAVEDSIAGLRADVQSLYSHGPIPTALGKLHQAVAEVMNEAKERALHEALHPRRRKGAA